MLSSYLFFICHLFVILCLIFVCVYHDACIFLVSYCTFMRLSFWTWHRIAWWSFSHQCMDKETGNSCPQQGCSGWQSFFRETTGNLYLCFSVHTLLCNCIFFSLFFAVTYLTCRYIFSSWSLSLAWISVCLVVWKVLISLCVFMLPQAAARRWACAILCFFIWW